MQPSEVKADFKVLSVSSKVFHDNGSIPRRYTCEGENINPPLDIAAIPKEAKSLVLIVEDRDAPSGNWLHWLVWNIPITHHIHQDEVPGDQGLNDFGQNMYGGPCPPSGTHRYFFKMYALDTLLDLPEGSKRSDLEGAMRDHVIAFGELTGIYKRARK